VVEVPDASDMQLALTGRKLRDVRDPALVRTAAVKSRLSPSGAGAMSGRRFRHLRLWAPISPSLRINRATGFAADLVIPSAELPVDPRAP
jgi:hypothetical protein